MLELLHRFSDGEITYQIDFGYKGHTTTQADLQKTRLTMKPTQVLATLLALFATTAIAMPGPKSERLSVKARGCICDFMGPAADDACSTICKYGGNGKGGLGVGE